MKWIMRYNDWQNDPLSKNNAGNAISSRNDLIGLSPSRFSSPLLTFSTYGGIDSKVTSFEFFQDGMKVHAQSGPTHYQQPPFDWRDFPDQPHYGHPTFFDFGFHEYSILPKNN